MRPPRSLVRLLTWAVAAVGLLVSAAPSQAYRMIQNTSTGRVTSGYLVTCNDPGGFTHWTTMTTNWFHNTAGQGAGKGAALQAAMATWTNVSSANHTLNYVGTTSAGWATDGQNTLLWGGVNDCTSCLALTALVLQSGQVIVESDVIFNSSYTWNTNGADYDTQAVATHELGHSLGIHHTEITSTPRPTMYAYYFGVDGRTLDSDDQQALQCSQTVYGGGGGGVPPVPILSNEPEYCRGMASLNWSSSSGATFYEVQKASSSSFSSPTLIYSGPDTTLFHDGGNGTRYYRVRACNSNGCSGYSNFVVVKYYSPCL
jgi:matrixin